MALWRLIISSSQLCPATAGRNQFCATKASPCSKKISPKLKQESVVKKKGQLSVSQCVGKEHRNFVKAIDCCVPLGSGKLRLRVQSFSFHTDDGLGNTRKVVFLHFICERNIPERSQENQSHDYGTKRSEGGRRLAFIDMCDRKTSPFLTSTRILLTASKYWTFG